MGCRFVLDPRKTRERRSGVGELRRGIRKERYKTGEERLRGRGRRRGDGEGVAYVRGAT